MQFHESALGQNILPQIPNAIKHIASISESLRIIASHYTAAEENNKLVDILESADNVCFDCILQDRCDTCPVSINVQVTECNRKVNNRYGPDIKSKVVLADSDKLTYSYIKDGKQSNEVYETASAAYEALVKELDGDIFKD